MNECKLKKHNLNPDQFSATSHQTYLPTTMRISVSMYRQDRQTCPRA